MPALIESKAERKEAMSFADQKPHVVTAENLAVWKRVKKRFNCALCGHVFTEGDTYRFIFVNGTPGVDSGNYFVCSACDGDEADVVARGKASFEAARRAAIAWGIYGPDWL